MAGPLTRGFLFADLRGYTSYLDRRGAVAAAALLDRFRTIVRTAVAAHHGAEIRTEGDSFYVVFPSASVAVACALDIVRAAGDSAVHEEPIPVGIGVHAGEALETPEGPVGTAVNIAARLCAMARPGEVLVSDTVRALTRSVGHAGFVSVGRRRIKGLDESLSVYRAVPAGTAAAPARRRIRGRAVPVVVALVALLAVAGVGAARWLTAPPPREPATATDGVAASRRPAAAPATPRPVGFGALPRGTYATVNFQPSFTLSIGDGWVVESDDPDVFQMRRVRGESAFVAYRANVVYTGPCAESPTQRIEPGSDAFLDWLEAHPHLEAVNPRPRIVDGVTGLEIDVIGGERSEACAEDSANPDRRIYLVALAGGGGMYALPGEDARFIVVDLPAGTVSFALFTQPDRFAEEFRMQAEAVMDNIDFTDAGG